MNDNGVLKQIGEVILELDENFSANHKAKPWEELSGQEISDLKRYAKTKLSFNWIYTNIAFYLEKYLHEFSKVVNEENYYEKQTLILELFYKYCNYTSELLKELKPSVKIKKTKTTIEVLKFRKYWSHPENIYGREGVPQPSFKKSHLHRYEEIMMGFRTLDDNGVDSYLKVEAIDSITSIKNALQEILLELKK